MRPSEKLHFSMFNSIEALQKEKNMEVVWNENLNARLLTSGISYVRLLVDHKHAVTYSSLISLQRFPAVGPLLSVGDI